MLRPLPPAPANLAYAKAMNESDDLLRQMKEASRSTDSARGVMADIWHQRNNVPFMVTVREAVLEMKAPFEGTTARAPPLKQPDENQK